MKRQLLGQDQTAIQITTWIVNQLLSRQLLPEKKQKKTIILQTQSMQYCWMLLSNQNFEFDNTKWSGWRYNGCGSWLLGVTSNKYVTSSRWSSICPWAHAAPSGGCTCNYYKCKAGNETCTCICSHFSPSLLPPISPTSLPMSSPSQDPHQRKTNDL